VRLQANVRDVVFQGERATGVRAIFRGEGERELTAPVVVDATGQTALVSRKLGLKAEDPKLKHAAFFTRFKGALRGEGIDEGATLIMQTEQDQSWFWYIPLPDDVVSVGVVAPIDYLLMGRPGEPQAVFDQEMAICPALIPRLQNATQNGKVQVLRDFSYISKRVAGDGWVMVGDAFGFLDPIYSSGVFLALKSAEFAADAINEAFEARDFSAARLGQWGDRYLQGMESMRKLVYAYYDKSFNVPKFLSNHPEHRENIVHLLIGNVFRISVDGLFDAMGRETELPDARKLEPTGATS
jgi:flavin-dependent dehydrogenase